MNLRPITDFIDGICQAVRRELHAHRTVTHLIYDFLEEDRQFTGEEYPSHPDGGVFVGSTTPWLADIHSVPPSWSWTPADLAAITARNLQIKAATSHVQANAPRQRCEGATAAEILHQRYSQGLWSPAVFAPAQVEAMLAHWVQDDAELARQRLGGANPHILAKYRGSSSDLFDTISGSAGAHDAEALLSTLETARAQDALFVCDYRPTLGGVVREGYVRAGRHFAVPLVFFTLDTNHTPPRLMPAAIQLDALEGGYVFTPQDDANTWLLAKLWVASSDTQSWFSGTHLFRTHSVAALFGVTALQRIQGGELSSSHPIITLMQPHLRKVFDINHFVYDAKAYERAGGRQSGIYQRGRSDTPGLTDALLPTGRIGIYQIIHDLYAGFRFDEQAFDRDIEARQVDAGSLPISYPFRDDGQVWWDAILGFVSEVVHATYASDAALAADGELVAWMELVEAAFNHGGARRFTWTPRRDALTRALANVVFTCSVQHAAVNNAQLDQTGFMPNGAYAMTAAPPTGPGVTDEALLASLPDPKEATDGTYAAPFVAQLSLAMAGTSPVPEGVAGDGEPGSLHETYPFPEGSAQRAAVARFHDALWTGPDSVRARVAANQAARIAACAAQPVPNSVAYRYLGVHLAPGDPVNAPTTRCIQI